MESSGEGWHLDSLRHQLQRVGRRHSGEVTKILLKVISFQVEPAVPYGLTNISYNDYSPLPPDYYLKATAKWALELAANNNS